MRLPIDGELAGLASVLGLLVHARIAVHSLGAHLQVP